MTNYDLHYLELTEVAHLLQTRKLSPVELTQALILEKAVAPSIDAKLRG